MDRLFLGVVRLGKAAQKHYHSGNVLIGPSELWGIVPPSMVLCWTRRARPRAPLAGLCARGAVWCAERAGPVGDWFSHCCCSSLMCSRVSVGVSA